MSSCAISVIVPTRNRVERLRRCLAALARQTYCRDRFEVVVVDDGSEQSLTDVLDSQRDDLQVRVIEQEQAGPARARNAGAKHAAGALLAFTDDDCEPEPTWLEALYTAHQQWPDRALGGRIVNALPRNVFSSASQLLVDYLYEYQSARASTRAETPPQTMVGERKRVAGPAFFTSNNLAIPAALFRAVNGFNVAFPLAAGEDREFCDRWQQSGYHLQWVSAAVVKHAHDLSLATFWRQHLQYGRGAFQLRQARISRGATPIYLEPLSFYRRLLTYPLRTRGSGRVPMLMLLLFLSQIANASGFVLERRRSV
jgi:GT2 family glycosyltransferase